MAGKAEDSVRGSAPNAGDWTSITPNLSHRTHCTARRNATGGAWDPVMHTPGPPRPTECRL